MSLSASGARDLVRNFARNAGDSTEYPDSQIDNAILAIGHRFVRRTKCTRSKSTLTLTLGNNSLPTFTSGFRPEYILRARLSGNDVNQELKIIDYDAMLDKRQANDDSAAPEFLAFDTYTTGEVYPEPDFAYTLTIWWVPVFDSSTFNIPDQWLYEVLIYGATALLQHTEPRHKYASESWKKYLEVEASAMGAGGLGVQQYDSVLDESDTPVPLFDANGMEL